MDRKEWLRRVLRRADDRNVHSQHFRVKNGG